MELEKNTKRGKKKATRLELATENDGKWSKMDPLSQHRFSKILTIAVLFKFVANNGPRGQGAKKVDPKGILAHSPPGQGVGSSSEIHCPWKRSVGVQESGRQGST